MAGQYDRTVITHADLRVWDRRRDEDHALAFLGRAVLAGSLTDDHGYLTGRVVVHPLDVDYARRLRLLRIEAEQDLAGVQSLLKGRH